MFPYPFEEFDPFDEKSVRIRPLRRRRKFGDMSYRLNRRQRRPKDYIGPLPKGSTLKRLKGKDRMTWHRWLCDWRTSLHKLGFVCQNDLVQSRRTSINSKGSRRRESLCLVQDNTAIFLYASVHALPKTQDVAPSQFSTVYHIVRGRRPDSSIGVKRQPDGTATEILPNVDLSAHPGLLVDFDGSLFGLDEMGVWKETGNECALYLNRVYRENSNRYKSIRPYHKKADLEAILHNKDFFRNSDFDDCTPKFQPIRELR